MGAVALWDVDILLVGGLQGSGKSHLATTHFADRRRVNRDEIRSFHKLMTTGEPWRPGDWNASVEPLITEIEMATLRFELERGHRVVVDNTFINERLRAPYIRLGRELGKTVGCLFLDLPFEYCLEKNTQRERRVPEAVLEDYRTQLRLPRDEEGLDHVRVVRQPVSALDETRAV